MELPVVEHFKREENDRSLCTLLMERLLSVTEREHYRLATLLHDDLLQLGCQMERLLCDLQELPSFQEHKCETLAEATQVSNTLVRHLRGMVVELYPPPLQMVGLQESLQMLLQGVRLRTQLSCSLQSDRQAERLLTCIGHEREALLYSIVREAVMNTVKHARAASLKITFRGDNAFLYIDIQDDGDGFVLTTIGELLRTGHLGLASLQERVQQMRGTLQIKTVLGSGTTIGVCVPADDYVEKGAREC